MWFQKISIPPAWRDLEILERERDRGGGGGVKDPGNSRGEGVWSVNLVSSCYYLLPVYMESPCNGLGSCQVSVNFFCENLVSLLR